MGIREGRVALGVKLIAHTLRDIADAVIRYEVERQRWLEQKEERHRDDKSKSEFFDSRWCESYWHRIQISRFFKDF